jgi:transcriptional regulator with XRE-family HTH domain
MPFSKSASFAALLRHHRCVAALTQEELAERAGLSRRGIADLERGARLLPHAATVERLSAALCLSDAERVALVAAGRQRKTDIEAESPCAHTAEFLHASSLARTLMLFLDYMQSTNSTAATYLPRAVVD